MKPAAAFVDSYFTQLQTTLARVPVDRVEQVIATLIDAARRERTIFICGNGGSASTASHFACDLSKNTAVPGAPSFRVIALTDNMALMTAWANDTDYSNVFAAQLAPLLNAGDVLIGISCSGNSANVLNAVALARRRGATTIAFTGDLGGRLKPMADLCLQVPSPHIEQQEDVHLILEHAICAAIRDELARRAAPSTRPAAVTP